MKKVLVIIFTAILFSGFAQAADINIDVSSSSMEIVNGTTIRIHNVNASSTDISSGIYWADFQWDAVNYLFVPVNYGEEQSVDPIMEKTELLIGTWHMSYTIVSTYYDTYNLTSIDPTKNSTGGYYVHGINKDGKDVIASYNPALSAYLLLSPLWGTYYDSFVFTTDGQTVLSGSCYFLFNSSDNSVSQCYPLYGYKTALSATSISSASMEDLRGKILESTKAMDTTNGDMVKNIWSLILAR